MTALWLSLAVLAWMAWGGMADPFHPAHAGRYTIQGWIQYVALLAIICIGVIGFIWDLAT